MTSASVGRVLIAMPGDYARGSDTTSVVVMSAYAYTVDVAAEDGGPEPELRERFATVIAYRLGQLADRDGVYPKAGDAYDFMDAFEGRFIWEMTDADLEATPPTLVDFEVVAVDPAEPAGSGPVAVSVRIPF